MTPVRPRRTNGLERPFTGAQVSTWVFLPLLVLEFLLFVSPLLPLAASIPCTLVFCFFAGASTYYGILAMKVDPRDPRLSQLDDDNDNENNNEDDGNNNNNHTTPQCTPVDDSSNNNRPRRRLLWDPEEPTKQCWICDIQVGEKSMHCKFCNKCVDHFDHHCLWLNTCVGKANYVYFFRCMISIAGMLVIQATIQLALILDIYLGNGATKQRSEEWLGANNATIAVVIVMGIFLFFNLGALSLIGQLLLFHIRLQRQGLSTYQFIVQDNQKRREKNKREEELKLQRTMQIAHAKANGNGFLAFRLQQAGWRREKCGLTWCDPLRMEEEEEEEDNHHEKAPGNGVNGNGHAITNDTLTPSGPLDGDDNDSSDDENV